MANVYWGAPEAIADNANPFALLLGDSWLWYPLDNLAVDAGKTRETKKEKLKAG